MIRFLLVFGLLGLVIGLEPVIEEIREPYCEFLARSVAFSLRLIGLNPALVGSTIVAGFGRGLTVIPQCDGLILLVLFIAGVAATPLQRSLRPYLWAGAFLALLVIINWVRLAILAVTGFYQPDLLEVIHVYVIQGVLILAVVLLYLVWLSQLTPEPAGMEAPKPSVA
jgi:exosortase/archaeosortase family protein